MKKQLHLLYRLNPELAMAEADKVGDDEELRKKLWLMVAKHVVEQEEGAKRENIQKEAICSSLEDYNKQIEQLKQEMNDATHGADNIRNDISALAQRYAVIDCDEDCRIWRHNILTMGGDYQMAPGYMSVGPMAPFYVFPCRRAFHAYCLIAHVTRSTNETQAEYILDLQKQLTLLGSESRKDSNGVSTEDSITSMTTTEKLRSHLDDAVASECPFCGDLMIREVSLPFMAAQEAHQVSSWQTCKPEELSLPA